MLMVMHLINTSVDPVDPWFDSVYEDMILNEMETITEIIAEQLLDIEDCFEERDEPNSESKNTLKLAKLVSDYVYTPTLGQETLASTKKTVQPNHYNLLRHQFSPELTTPPPDFAA